MSYFDMLRTHEQRIDFLKRLCIPLIMGTILIEIYYSFSGYIGPFILTLISFSIIIFIIYIVSSADSENMHHEFSRDQCKIIIPTEGKPIAVLTDEQKYITSDETLSESFIVCEAKNSEIDVISGRVYNTTPVYPDLRLILSAADIIPPPQGNRIYVNGPLIEDSQQNILKIGASEGRSDRRLYMLGIQLKQKEDRIRSLSNYITKLESDWKQAHDDKFEIAKHYGHEAAEIREDTNLELGTKGTSRKLEFVKAENKLGNYKQFAHIEKENTELKAEIKQIKAQLNI